MSSQVLNIFKGEYTTSPAKQFQSPTTLIIEAFSYVQIEFHVFQITLMASYPATGHHWKGPGPILFSLSSKNLYTDEIPLGLL